MTGFAAYFSAMMAFGKTILQPIGSALVAALSALLVVHVTNRSSDKRLRLQFSHERELRAKERDLTLRKDVYLSVANAAYIGISAVAELADLKHPSKEIQKSYNNESSSVSKLYILANAETAKEVTRLFAEISTSLMKLTALRSPLDVNHARVDTLKHFAESSRGEQQLLLNEMKVYNLGAAQDPNNGILSNVSIDQLPTDGSILRPSRPP